MAFAPLFAQMMASLTVKEDFSNWLKAQGVLDAEGFALLASAETDIKPDILDVAKSAGVKFESMGDSVNVKKLWMLCRKSMSSGDGRNSEPSTEAAIPVESETDLKKKWIKTYGILLPDAFMLVCTLQGKLWRECGSAASPKLTVLRAEQLRTLACLDKMVGHHLAVVPGRPVETLEVIHDDINRRVELYVRVRAYFHTLAYVCCYKPDFFDLQTAIIASEKVLTLTTKSYDGEGPPVSFLVAAWGATMHHFSEQLRLTGGSLKAIVLNTGAWESSWTRWTPSQQSRSVACDSDVQQLHDKIEHLEEQVRKHQAAKDRAESHAKGSKGKGSGFNAYSDNQWESNKRFRRRR